MLWLQAWPNLWHGPKGVPGVVAPQKSLPAAGRCTLCAHLQQRSRRSMCSKPAMQRSMHRTGAAKGGATVSRAVAAGWNVWEGAKLLKQRQRQTKTLAKVAAAAFLSQKPC